MKPQEKKRELCNRYCAACWRRTELTEKIDALVDALGWEAAQDTEEYKKLISDRNKVKAILAEALWRLRERDGYEIETAIVFEAHEATPYLFICYDYIPREAWEKIHEAGAIEKLDRESLKAKFGSALSPDPDWWGSGWYYKRAAIEILRALGFTVKVRLWTDRWAEGHIPFKEILPARTRKITWNTKMKRGKKDETKTLNCPQGQGE